MVIPSSNTWRYSQYWLLAERCKFITSISFWIQVAYFVCLRLTWDLNLSSKLYLAFIRFYSVQFFEMSTLLGKKSKSVFWGFVCLEKWYFLYFVLLEILKMCLMTTGYQRCRWPVKCFQKIYLAHTKENFPAPGFFSSYFHHLNAPGNNTASLCPLAFLPKRFLLTWA